MFVSHCTALLGGNSFEEGNLREGRTSPSLAKQYSTIAMPSTISQIRQSMRALNLSGSVPANRVLEKRIR
jgi:hypothetical protein